MCNCVEIILLFLFFKQSNSLCCDFRSVCEQLNQLGASRAKHENIDRVLHQYAQFEDPLATTTRTSLLMCPGGLYPLLACMINEVGKQNNMSLILCPRSDTNIIALFRLFGTAQTTTPPPFPQSLVHSGLIALPARPTKVSDLINKEQYIND